MSWRERETVKRRIVLAVIAIGALATLAQVACEGAPINFSLFAQERVPAKQEWTVSAGPRK